MACAIYWNLKNINLPPSFVPSSSCCLQEVSHNVAYDATLVKGYRLITATYIAEYLLEVIIQLPREIYRILIFPVL
jgi:hypothetical protein